MKRFSQIESTDKIISNGALKLWADAKLGKLNQFNLSSGFSTIFVEK